MLDRPNIYLIGIGGIGMSALARYFHSLGKNVGGYDRVQSELCLQLEAEGMAIHYNDDVEAIDNSFKKASDTTVIYTPAIPDEMGELQFFRSKKFNLLKRAEVLGKISQNHTCLAVAGTHGKTTTSALLAHLFKSAGHPITAFLGGIATNYQSNFIAGEKDGILVAEADEYDRSFLQLNPEGAIITSVDSDHLDIYGEAEELKATFKQFRDSITQKVVTQKDTEFGGITYAVDATADFQAHNLHIEDHNYSFDLNLPDGQKIEGIKSGLPGRHNIENATAAAALALQFGLKPNEISKGISTFKGVRRRFEYHIKSDSLVYIDDYAHHPAEITALLNSVKELYPGQKITGIFQPHLYSRTRDFADEFVTSLELLDELILMDIYPAREKPIPGINSAMLLYQIEGIEKHHMGAQEILTHFAEQKPQVVLTIGAGDIDKLIQPLKMKLLQ